MNGFEYPQQRMSSFISAVYGFMAVALVITAAVAYYVSTTPAIYTLFFGNPVLLFLLFIGQLALVIGLAIALPRLNFGTALAMFFLYAISVGLTLSAIFLVYELGSIYQTFVVTAGMFGIMCIYGYFTKSDLTAIGNIAIMALLGLILSMLVNMFLRSEQFDYIISAIGVLVFTVLTAYDTQKIKRLGQQLLDHEMLNKVAILGALTLYLDFINLFLFLLRFMGKKRER